MKRRRKRKCKHCGLLYWPDPRTRYHQRHCSALECQRVRHRANQHRWLAKAENQNYFRGPEQVQRVQTWRKAHREYGRKKPKTLQDVTTEQPIDNQGDKACLNRLSLQDVILMQPALLVGIIASLMGSALQDEIVPAIRKMHHRGQAILNPMLGIEKKGTDDARKAFVMSG
jgi:hypothetical protein